MADVTPTRTRSRALLRVVAQWLVPGMILGVFVWSGHLGQAVTAIRDISLVWAMPLALTGIALPLVHAWRWCFLLRRVDEQVPLSSSARITALSSLLNYAAPGFLGAPAKAVFARESNGVSIGRSLPTLAAEQLLDAAMLAVFGALAVLLVGPELLDVARAAPAFAQVAWVFAGAVGLVVLLVAAWFIARRLLPGFAATLVRATRTLLGNREHLSPIVALTIARWCLDMLAVGVASIAVGLRLSIVEILLIANLALLIGLISPVPGGIGVREVVMAAIAGVIGVSIPSILALSVLHRAGLAVGLPILLVGARLREWGAR